MKPIENIFKGVLSDSFFENISRNAIDLVKQLNYNEAFYFIKAKCGVVGYCGYYTQSRGNNSQRLTDKQIREWLKLIF